MQRIFDHIEALDDISEVLQYSASVCREQGVVRQSCHLTPIFDEPNSMRTAVYAEGFSDEWVELYERADFRQSDPIPARTMEHGTMLPWTEAMDLQPNTPENETYFAAMRKHGLVHGFGLPLYGPRGRNCYASYDFGQALENVDPAALGVIRSVSQATHQRVAVLIEKFKNPPHLSARELEVLTWIARGKSIPVIGTILDLSQETVKTYVKRIYSKLDASDRVGAAVKAMKLDLLRF